MMKASLQITMKVLAVGKCVRRKWVEGKREEAVGNREELLDTTLSTVVNIHAGADSVEKCSLTRSSKSRLAHRFNSLLGGFLHFIVLGNNLKHVNEFMRRD